MNFNAKGQARHYLHWNPERTDFTVTPEELSRLETAGSSLWKDVCLTTAPLGLSCLINAVADTSYPFKLTLALFLNYILGILGLVLAIIFGIAWRKSSRTFSRLIRQIKDKPRVEIVPTTTNVGSIQVAPLSSGADGNPD